MEESATMPCESFCASATSSFEDSSVHCSSTWRLNVVSDMLLNHGMGGYEASEIFIHAPALNPQNAVPALLQQKTKGEVQAIVNLHDTESTLVTVPQCFVSDDRNIQCQLQRDVSGSEVLWSLSSSKWDNEGNEFKTYCEEKQRTVAPKTPLRIIVWDRKSFGVGKFRNYIKQEEVGSYNLPVDCLHFAAENALFRDTNLYTNTGKTNFLVVRLDGLQYDVVVTLHTLVEWIELYAIAEGTSRPLTDNEFHDAMIAMMTPNAAQTPCNSPRRAVTPSLRPTTPSTPPTTIKRRDDPKSPLFDALLNLEYQGLNKRARNTYQLVKNITTVTRSQGT
jgi:hypothetical protein